MGRAISMDETPWAVADRPYDGTDEQRVAALRSYKLLDTAPEAQFDSVVALARVLFDTPIAALSLVDHDRQWFKSQDGLRDQETPREHSFCSRAMHHGDVFVVHDASVHPMFAENPLVTGDPSIRFYAGAPLLSPGGHPLGALCVISSDARADFSDADKHKLKVLAGVVGNEMELRRRAVTAQRALDEYQGAIRESQYKLRNSVGFVDLLADVESAEISTDALSAISLTAWRQYTEAGEVLMRAIKSLRGRLSKDEYTRLVESMPGFML